MVTYSVDIHKILFYLTRDFRIQNKEINPGMFYLSRSMAEKITRVSGFITVTTLCEKGEKSQYNMIVKHAFF